MFFASSSVKNGPTNFVGFLSPQSAAGRRISAGEQEQLLLLPLPEGLTGDHVLGLISRQNRTADYNAAGIYQSVNGDYFDNQTIDQLRRWQKPGDITDVPQARLYAANGTQVSSRWVTGGSFFRVKNITLGYTFPANWMSKIGIKSVRVYFACDNVFFASKRKGYDPRTSMGGQGATVALNSVDGTYYSPIRTTSVGLNINF